MLSTHPPPKKRVSGPFLPSVRYGGVTFQFIGSVSAQPHVEARTLRTPGSGPQTRLVLGGLAAEKQMAHEDSLPRARWRCRACRPWGASTAQHCVTCPLWICRGRGGQDDSWALAPTLSEPGVKSAGGQSIPILPGQGAPRPWVMLPGVTKLS